MFWIIINTLFYVEKFWLQQYKTFLEEIPGGQEEGEATDFSSKFCLEMLIFFEPSPFDIY